MWARDDANATRLFRGFKVVVIKPLLENFDLDSGVLVSYGPKFKLFI